MWVSIADELVNTSLVKRVCKIRDHLQVLYADNTYDEFVFISEPAARAALVKLAQRLSVDTEFEASAMEVDE